MFNNIPRVVGNLTPISFLVWNVQGAGNQAFVSALKEVIRVNKPTATALLETHMNGEYAAALSNKIGFQGHLRVDAEGFSRGIWVYWKPDIVAVDEINRSNQHLSMQISRIDEEPWYFTAIYASPHTNNKHQLWQYLQEFAKTHNKPWLLSGDFNDTRYTWERSSMSEDTSRRARQFNEWIGNMELIELEFSGPSRTWSRGFSEETRKSARLDRSLCDTAWASRFYAVSMKNLPAI